MVIEMLVNADYVKHLEKENAQLRDKLKKNNKVKIIEINDNREVVPEDLDWSRTW